MKNRATHVAFSAVPNCSTNISFFVVQNSAEKIASSQYRKLKGIVDDERTKLESSRMREGKVETTFSCILGKPETPIQLLCWMQFRKCVFLPHNLSMKSTSRIRLRGKGVKKHPYVVRKKSIVSSRFNWEIRPSLSHLFLAFFVFLRIIFCASPRFYGRGVVILL